MLVTVVLDLYRVDPVRINHHDRQRPAHRPAQISH